MNRQQVFNRYRKLLRNKQITSTRHRIRSELLKQFLEQPNQKQYMEVEFFDEDRSFAQKSWISVINQEMPYSFDIDFSRFKPGSSRQMVKKYRQYLHLKECTIGEFCRTIPIINIAFIVFEFSQLSAKQQNRNYVQNCLHFFGRHYMSLAHSYLFENKHNFNIVKSTFCKVEEIFKKQVQAVTDHIKQPILINQRVYILALYLQSKLKVLVHARKLGFQYQEVSISSCLFYFQILKELTLKKFMNFTDQTKEILIVDLIGVFNLLFTEHIYIQQNQQIQRELISFSELWTITMNYLDFCWSHQPNLNLISNVVNLMMFCLEDKEENSLVQQFIKQNGFIVGKFVLKCLFYLSSLSSIQQKQILFWQLLQLSDCLINRCLLTDIFRKMADKIKQIILSGQFSPELKKKSINIFYKLLPEDYNLTELIDLQIHFLEINPQNKKQFWKINSTKKDQQTKAVK